ncbi:MAG TPA: glycosyltransferase family 4 protein [Longimicrobium sp.]|nr:glycosyltransferase family 4 protein [Longimicrobium sp.]
MSAPGPALAQAGRGRTGGEHPLRLLVIGEEHIRPKMARHYHLLERETGIRTHFFADDRSGITREMEDAVPMRVHYAPSPRAGVPAYWAAFRRCFQQVKPDVLEVYTAINFAVVLPMMLYAAAHGVPRVVVCRGELYPPLLNATSAWSQRFLARALRNCQLIVYKELYMDEALERLAPRVPRKLRSNAIPVGPEPSYARRGNEVLFLNFFKAFRNPDLVVRAAPLVRERVPDVRFRLVGGTERLESAGAFYADLNAYERGLRELISRVGAHEYVEVLPFTTDVRPYYDAAKVFLLPSDLVFCNYALLEAMERGVPTIVSADRDANARRIVRDRVNGRVVALDERALADAIVEMLTDEERRREMGRQARRTMVESFNLRSLLDEIADTYAGLAARRRGARAA